MYVDRGINNIGSISLCGVYRIHKLNSAGKETKKVGHSSLLRGRSVQILHPQESQAIWSYFGSFWQFWDSKENEATLANRESFGTSERSESLG